MALPTEGNPSAEKPKIGIRKGLQLRSDIKKGQGETIQSLEPILTNSQLKAYERFQKEKNKLARKKFSNQ